MFRCYCWSVHYLLFQWPLVCIHFTAVFKSNYIDLEFVFIIPSNPFIIVKDRLSVRGNTVKICRLNWEQQNSLSSCSETKMLSCNKSSRNEGHNVLVFSYAHWLPSSRCVLYFLRSFSNKKQEKNALEKNEISHNFFIVENICGNVHTSTKIWHFRPLNFSFWFVLLWNSIDALIFCPLIHHEGRLHIRKLSQYEHPNHSKIDWSLLGPLF